MYRKTIVKIIIFSMVVVLFLASCKTLPIPKSENDSLLIIPISYEKKSTKDWFGHYKITITSSSTGKVVKTMMLPILNGFTKISGLEPGNYNISQDVFVYDKSSVNHKGTIARRYISFTIQPEHITILPYKFTYIIFDQSSTHYVMNRKWSNFSRSEIDKLFNSLEDYKNFSLWKN